MVRSHRAILEGKAFPSGLLLRRAALPLLAGTPRNAPQSCRFAVGLGFWLRTRSRTLRGARSRSGGGSVPAVAALRRLLSLLHRNARPFPAHHCSPPGNCQSSTVFHTVLAPLSGGSALAATLTGNACQPHPRSRRPTTAYCRTQRRPPVVRLRTLVGSRHRVGGLRPPTTTRSPTTAPGRCVHHPTPCALVSSLPPLAVWVGWMGSAPQHRRGGRQREKWVSLGGALRICSL